MEHLPEADLEVAVKWARTAGGLTVRAASHYVTCFAAL